MRKQDIKPGEIYAYSRFKQFNEREVTPFKVIEPGVPEARWNIFAEYETREEAEAEMEKAKEQFPQVLAWDIRKVEKKSYLRDSGPTVYRIIRLYSYSLAGTKNSSFGYFIREDGTQGRLQTVLNSSLKMSWADWEIERNHRRDLKAERDGQRQAYRDRITEAHDEIKYIVGASLPRPVWSGSLERKHITLTFENADQFELFSKAIQKLFNE